jgi:poly(3-hydroxybutyrate) depolymerase
VLTLTSAVAVGLPLTASASPDVPAHYQGQGRGTVDHYQLGKLNGGVLYSYLVYKPVGWTTRDRLPLMVVLHGCGLSAAKQMSIDLLNQIADRERFLVLRGDNQASCWHAVSDDALATSAIPDNNHDIIRGGEGDADIVATMTKRVTARYHADADRVYIIGASSGSFQASATAAAYPDLYAGVGSGAGGGPGMSTLCATYPDALIPSYAASGVQSMGKRAHLMPVIALAGTRDYLGEQPVVGGCSRLAFKEWVYINNMLTPSPWATLRPGDCVLLPPGIRPLTQANADLCADTFTIDPFSRTKGKVRNGFTWTKDVARGSFGGCEIAQNWAVDGMGHAWSGGSSDAAATEPWSAPGAQTVSVGFSEPRGPNFSQLSWDFLSTFSLHKLYAATKSYHTACSALTG